MADDSDAEGSMSFDLPENAEDYLDIETFEQILEMDDGEASKEFSRALVFGFFEQADATFEEMDEMIEEKDLHKLSQLGHFLKGSSATLGLKKVRDSCEKIQHWGEMKDDTGTTDVEDEAGNLKKIKDIMPIMRKDYTEVEKFLKDWYGPEADEE